MRIARRFFSFSALCLATFLVGCGSGSDRLPVSGTVTFKGNPLDQGTIQFIPQGKEKTHGFAPIEKGAFTIPGQEPGSYKVVISSGDPKKKVEDAAPGVSGPPAAERIPADFNVNSKVVKEVTPA